MTLSPGMRLGPYEIQSALGAGGMGEAERQVLALNADAMPVLYSRGHLLFVRDATLMAQPFSLMTFELTGEAFPIAESIQITGGPAPYNAIVSASANGVVAYRTGIGERGSELHWFDRSGNVVGRLGDQADYGDLELSPDGARAAVSIFDFGPSARDLWVFDIARSVRTRLTFDPAQDRFPTWSSDGSHYRFFVFSARQRGFVSQERERRGDG